MLGNEKNIYLVFDESKYKDLKQLGKEFMIIHNKK